METFPLRISSTNLSQLQQTNSMYLLRKCLRNTKKYNPTPEGSRPCLILLKFFFLCTIWENFLIHQLPYVYSATQSIIRIYVYKHIGRDEHTEKHKMIFIKTAPRPTYHSIIPQKNKNIYMLVGCLSLFEHNIIKFEASYSSPSCISS